MLNALCMQRDIRSFSLSAENPTGEKGRGGQAVTGTGAAAARELGVGWKVSPSVVIPAGGTYTLADIRGQGAIRHIWITDSAPRGRVLILRAWWDGSDHPAVEVPLGDFFARASYPEYHPLSSLAVCIGPSRGLNSYWEMPYRTGFHMTLENLAQEDITVYYQIDCEEKAVATDALYFHARFRRENPVPYGQPHALLEDVEGRGQYVGTYLYWGVHNNGWWGEGEMKFYIDGDSDYPSVCGTGTEDYFGGAYNFDTGGQYVPFTTPYSGMDMDEADGLYRAQRRFHLYRWHIEDPVYFRQNLRVTVQALGWRSEGRYLPLQDDVSSTAFFYLDRPEGDGRSLPDRNALEIQ